MFLFLLSIYKLYFIYLLITLLLVEHESFSEKLLKLIIALKILKITLKNNSTF